MAVPRSLSITMFYRDRVEGIVHVPDRAMDAPRWSPDGLAGDCEQLHASYWERDAFGAPLAKHPVLELEVEGGRTVLTLAQLKGLLHTLEAEMEDVAHAS